MTAKNRSLENKFWGKVDKSGDCWLWTATRMKRAVCGYGVLRVNGKSELAHRVSYEMAYGKIPTDMKVLHRCDNPICVNPNHLFLGTQADNLIDMRTKGRAIRATSSPTRRKFTTEVAKQIRMDRAEFGYSYERLAGIYGLSDSTISRIVRGKTWADK